MPTKHSIWLNLCIVSVLLLTANCGQSSVSGVNTLSTPSSQLNGDDIYASYIINDGFLNYMRRTAVILNFYRKNDFSQSIYFDQGEKFYANGVEVNYYESSNRGYYSAWVDMQENDTHLEIKWVKKTGEEVVQNILLAERVNISNYSMGDTAPNLEDGIELNYEPAIAIQANFNIGGGECQNNYDHASSPVGKIAFGSSSVSDHDQAFLNTGETIYLRLRNRVNYGAPNGFIYGKIESNGYRNLELRLP